MTAQQAILTLGTITLTSCGAGLMLIHGKNPLLKGLNWMGASLLLGGLSALLILAAAVVPALEVLANVTILIAFLCCYRADLYLFDLPHKRRWLEWALVGCQSGAAVLHWSGLWSTSASTAILGFTVTTQLLITSQLIASYAVAAGRPAARFTVVLMRFLAVASVGRSVCAVAGLLDDPRWAGTLNLLVYNVFVASAIGLAFAFFWRTTTRLSHELEHMASTDPLTRVSNRRVFLNWCENEEARSKRIDAAFSVLMLDFDHFKRVNDTYGHLVGDQVLCAAVERIQDSIRGIDVLCRWGGEEFAVLLPNASREATEIVAERVRRNVPLFKTSGAQFQDARFHALTLSVSIGTATYEGAGDNYETMLQRADTALYEAKRNGRDRVVFMGVPRLETAFQPGSLVMEAQ